MDGTPALRRRTWWILIVLSSVSAAAADEDDGGRPLLDLVRTGVATTRAAHASGGVRARYSIGGVVVSRVDARWQDSDSRGRYVIRFGGDAEERERRPFMPEKLFVQNERVRAKFQPDDPPWLFLEYHHRDPSRPSQRELSVLPRDAWFDAGGPLLALDHFDFERLLDPDRDLSSYESREATAVRDGDEITVHRTWSQDNTFDATASLALGGNITEYTLVIPLSGTPSTFSGTLNWVADGDGYKVSDLTADFSDNGGARPTVRIEYEPLPAGRVPDDVPYTIASLNVPPEAGVERTDRGADGLSVVTKIVRRNSTRPERPPLDAAALRELGEATAGGSFADGD